MTPRQRMLSAIEFTAPDKIPVFYHSSPAGLHVHGEKLLRLFNEYPPDNAITFDAIPTPPVGAVDEKGSYYEVRRDDWGTGWEFTIFGIQGHPKTYPVESWDATEDYLFPSFPASDPAELAEQRKNYLIFKGGMGIFEKLHALRPMEEVLMDLAVEDPALLRFLDRLVDHYLQEIQNMIDEGVDVLMFGDDWGTQQATLVAPAMFRNIFKPRYEKLMAPIRKAGRKIFFHSCGYLGEILDDLVDLGIDGLWPQIALFDANPSFLEKCRKNKVSLFIHPDRQHLVPLGSPGEIETAIREYADRYHALGGGGIFYVEIENDAPFENVKALIESIHKWR